jgi:hypothetical protein
MWGRMLSLWKDKFKSVDRGLILALLLALPAGLPLVREGYFPSHDGLFHLYRVAGLDRAIHAGVLYPRWFPEFAYGYGYPVLNYYSPLAYYLGEIFHILGAGILLSTKLTFLTSILLGALGMYLFVREALGRFPALVAVVVYTYAPYRLADVYVRGALAESLAFVFMPLLLWVTHRLFTTKRPRYILGMALLCAALIVTHNLTALIFLPFLLLYMGLWAWTTRSGREFFLGLFSLLLAVGLSAFYWLPALLEMPWVGLAAGLGSTGYTKHLAALLQSTSPFLFYRYFPDQGVGAEYPLSPVQALLLLASLFAVIGLARRGKRIASWHVGFMIAVALLGIFMTLDLSLPLWTALQPILAPLQYPWRFMSLACLALAFLAGALVVWAQGQRASFWAILLGTAVMVFVPFNALPRLPLETLPMREVEVAVKRMWEEDFTHRQVGATWTAEYLPVWVRADRSELPLAPLRTPAMLSFPFAQVTVQKEGYTHYELTTAGEGVQLRFHIFYFPGWRAYVDGRNVGVYPSGDLGLVTVDVPSGEHRILLRFEDTRERLWGEGISAIAFVILVLAALRVAPRRLLLVSICLLFLVGLLLLHIRPLAFTKEVNGVIANLEGKVRLLGYSLDKANYRAGESVEISLYWLDLEGVQSNYKVFVHLTDEMQTRMLAQDDSDPVLGFTPTSRWLPGEIVIDKHVLRLPLEVPEGRYLVLIGMYQYPDIRNLTVLEPGLATADNRILLGHIEVED